MSPRGCEYDTDGDGNCARHPGGCPQPAPDVIGLLLDAYARRITEREGKLGGVWYEVDDEVRAIRETIEREVGALLSARSTADYFDRIRSD